MTLKNARLVLRRPRRRKRVEGLTLKNHLKELCSPGRTIADPNR